jgi:hypothetical protein
MAQSSNRRVLFEIQNMKTNLIRFLAAGAVSLFGAVTPLLAQTPMPSPTATPSPSPALFGVTYGSNQIITVDPATGSGTLVGNLGSVASAYGIASKQGTLYIFDQTTNKIGKINPVSGAIENEVALSVSGLSGEGDIAFDSQGIGYLASVFSSASGASLTPTNDFYTFDAMTGVTVRLGTTGVAINALAFDSTDTLYAIGEGDVDANTAPFGAATLYTVNVLTGATSKVADLSVAAGSPIGAMAFGPDGTLYTSLDDRLYTVDKMNGTATPVSTTLLDTNFSGISGLAFAPGVATLGNISTRASVGTGDNLEIAGFILTGSSSTRVLLRGIGPSLGISGALADPVLELFDSSKTSLERNDNWKDSPEATAIMATGIAPTNDKESAILKTLAVGNYTAQLSGANNTTGIGLVEAYDLDLGNGSSFANLSTRGNVQMADNVLIGGLFVSGSEPQRVVVRAIGPDLTSKGVANALQDPHVTVYDANGTMIAENDDYGTGPNTAELQQDGLTPGDSHDSALILDLAPSSYTAIVDGKAGTGIGLVEFYNLSH